MGKGLYAALKHRSRTLCAEPHLRIGDVGVAGGDAIAAGVKDQRLAFTIFVFFYFTDQDDVIAAIVLADFPANELRDGPMENGRFAASFTAFHADKFIRHGSGELAGEVVLFRFQHVYGEMRGSTEIVEAGRLPSEAPQDERRVQ